MVAGKNLVVKIAAIDKYGNTYFDGGYGYTFECLAYDMSNPSVYVTLQGSTDNLDGTYTSFLRLTLALKYGVLCYLDKFDSGKGFPLAANAQVVVVTPASVATDKTTVTGAGLVRAKVGVQQALVMVTRDEFGNKVSSGNVVFAGRVTGPVPVTLAFARNYAIGKDYGTYAVTYAVTKSGRYSLSIRRRGAHVTGSPWNYLDAMPGTPLPRKE